MEKNLIRLSANEFEALARTATLAGLSIEECTAVAAWAFAQADEAFRAMQVHQFLSQNSAVEPKTRSPRRTVGEESWYAISAGQAKPYLPKTRKGDYSAIQKITVAVRLSLQAPLEVRLQLTRAYRAHVRLNKPPRCTTSNLP
jgi:hypothetical protein